MKTKFDEEELDIIQAKEKNELKVSSTRNIDIDNAVKTAEYSLHQKVELSILLSERDLKNLKLKEIEVGIPYQNIVTALIHKYLENKITLTI